MYDEILQVDVGNILYSGPALISTVWQWRVKHRSSVNWRMNNFLLENKEVKQIVEAEIKNYFQVNEGSANSFIVWECFKVYMH